jgi:hypothetical protein
MKLTSSSRTAASSELIDAVMDAYVTWRERNAAVEVAYRMWSRAPEADRAVAYDGYAAALDREEFAADEYRRLVEQATGR